MKIESAMSEKVILQELGTRLAAYRLNKNMPQKVLAKEAGISLPTLQRIEQGQATNITNIIRLLRKLGLLGNFEFVVPEIPPSPIMQVRLGKKTRKRVSSKGISPMTSVTPGKQTRKLVSLNKQEAPSNTVWVWGEDE